MPLSQASLSARIISEVIALKGAATDAAELQTFADALAKAIVDEFQANALVTTTVTTPDTINGTGTGTVT